MIASIYKIEILALYFVEKAYHSPNVPNAESTAILIYLSLGTLLK